MDLVEKLREHLENGKDWEKLKTPIEGVYVVKMPAKGKLPAKLAIEVNPAGKRKGLYLVNTEQFKAFLHALSHEKLPSLFEAIDDVNGVETREESSSDVVGELDF
ncbi:MAG: hypothetical protein D6732_16430 [Methanobacteriota archaeon]|nr:MAG: hypothetical protein D6732_16430 [Euryarchaeota archaeon]